MEMKDQTENEDVIIFYNMQDSWTDARGLLWQMDGRGRFRFPWC